MWTDDTANCSSYWSFTLRFLREDGILSVLSLSIAEFEEDSKTAEAIANHIRKVLFELGLPDFKKQITFVSDYCGAYIRAAIRQLGCLGLECACHRLNKCSRSLWSRLFFNLTILGDTISSQSLYRVNHLPTFSVFSILHNGNH